jgi:lysophospholipase L1-like esterase
MRIVVLGGSVAFGAYASSIDATYYATLGRSLERRGIPAEITVIAAGAWKSVQELNAITLYLREEKPDWVIFLDGLNDLTNGATVDSLYGVRVEPVDGSEWNELYHAHDYPARVAKYLRQIEAATARVVNAGARSLVVLQPSLAERAPLTALEKEVLRGALLPHTSVEALRGSYAAIRSTLRELEGNGDVLHFLDASRLFDGVPETTFSDLWHFSDFGHQQLGEAISEKLAPLVAGEARTGSLQPREVTR